MININTITQEEYKKIERPIVVNYGFCSSPFGNCLIGITAKAICYLAFLNSDNREKALESLRLQWPNALLKEDKAAAQNTVLLIFQEGADKELNLYLKGTPFQIKVWQALLSLDVGSLVSYEEVAKAVERLDAVRAVASAIAQNKIAYLIPCHRVIHKSAKARGVMSYSYAFGSEIKKALLGWEANTCHPELVSGFQEA